MKTTTPTYINNWKISVTNLVSTIRAIYGEKTEHSRLERIETHGESHIVLISLIGNLVADKGNPERCIDWVG
jgi:hypothetical protein